MLGLCIPVAAAHVRRHVGSCGEVSQDVAAKPVSYVSIVVASRVVSAMSAAGQAP